MRPHRRQPTRLLRPWDSPGKNTGVGCHFLLQCRKVKVKSLSRVQPSATPWTAAFQAPPSMEFSRQEYWSGLLFPSPGDLPHPGIKPRSPTLQADSLPSEPPVRLHENDILHFFPEEETETQRAKGQVGARLFSRRFPWCVRGS